MLESAPQEVFQHICQFLNLQDINTLTHVNSTLRKAFIGDNIFWKYEFQRQFPHLVDTVTRNGEPKSWYLVFEKSYIDQYGLNDPDVNKRQEAYRKAALFTAAKKGNATTFKKLHQEECALRGRHADGSGYFSVNLCDKNRYLCYFWLRQNGHQTILDDLFTDVLPQLKNQADILDAVILFNQLDYLKQHINDFSNCAPNFTLAAQLGSLSLVKLLKLLFEKLSTHNFWSYGAFAFAASCGHIDVVEFIHQTCVEFTDKKIEDGQDDINKHYKNAMHQALQSAISYGHKKTVEHLLTIYKKDWFTLNGWFTPNYYDKKEQCEDTRCSFLLSHAALQADPDYVTMLLDAGIEHAVNDRDIFPVRHAVFAGNYEPLIVLLKHDVHKYSRIESYQRTIVDKTSTPDILRNFDHKKLKEWLSETPLKGEPRMRALVDLICYQYELEVEMKNSILSKLASLFSTVFSSPTKIEKTVEHKICDLLLDIVTRKRPTKVLSELNSEEKDALENKGSRLVRIYAGLFAEIQKIKEEEALAQTRESQLHLH